MILKLDSFCSSGFLIGDFFVLGCKQFVLLLERLLQIGVIFLPLAQALVFCIQLDLQGVVERLEDMQFIVFIYSRSYGQYIEYKKEGGSRIEHNYLEWLPAILRPWRQG